MENLELIKELTQAHGISGFETDVAKIIRKQLDGKAEITQDNLGSIICCKKGMSDSPKIMIPGHMDEIGFMVNSITKNGFIKFVPIGSWWDQVLLSQKVIINTKKGNIKGIIGSKPTHLMNSKEIEKIVEKKEMYIDIGAVSKENAIQMGVRLGDPIVPDSSFDILDNNLIMAKAFDDRLGCALFINLIKALHGNDHPNTVYGVGTVQEEVGLRGAVTAANAIQPDICITLEAGIATDTPGSENEELEAKLGAGPILGLADGSLIANRSLRDFVIDTAEKEQIPLQFFITFGAGTDAGVIHKNGTGVPSVVIAVPTRYIHSHYGIINYEDYESTLKLLLALIKGLDKDTVSKIKMGVY